MAGRDDGSRVRRAEPTDEGARTTEGRLRRRRLGSSAVEVTELGLGGAALGNLYRPVDDADARATVEAALAGGVDYIDTAPYYGYGLSEERVGAALAGCPPGSPVLSSKVGRLLLPRAGPPRSDQGFVAARSCDAVFDYTYDGVMRSWEASLRRLDRARIDVLLIHDIGAQTHGAADHPAVFEIAMQGAYRALDQLRRSNDIGAIGLGVNECAVCIEAMERGDFDCLLLAGRYTLLEQGALDALLPACATRGVSVIVGVPFNSGALVENPGEKLHYDYGIAMPAVTERIEALRRICAAHGVALPAAALRFPLLHERVAAVIPGARTPEEACSHRSWLDTSIPDSLWSDLVQAGLLDPRAPTAGVDKGSP